MNNEPFMDVTVQTVLFLELSDNNTVDEDAAVAMMEQIAGTLQRLGQAEKDRFLQFVQTRAERAATDVERQIMLNMANTLGLCDG